MRAILFCLLVLPAMTHAALPSGYFSEVTLYLGQRSSSDATTADGNTSLGIDRTSSFGISLGWPAEEGGLGQLLVSQSSQEFRVPANADTATTVIDFTTRYVHFGGVALYRSGRQITSISLGLGFAHLSADNLGSGFYPSLTAAIGARYELTPQWQIQLEGRVYATILDNNDDLFCSQGNCLAGMDGSVFSQTDIWAGISYHF